MGYRTEIEVYHCVDLTEYDDDIMDYMEPDSISDAMDLMERWGYSEGDILSHLMEDLDSSLLLSKLGDILNVDSALDLVKSIYHYGQDIRDSREEALRAQILELKHKANDLLADKVANQNKEQDHDS